MSKRFNLREFQQSLLQRMQEQAQSGDQAVSLGLLIGKEHWLVDMSDISEVLAVPHLTYVPLTKPWYSGVANVRGNVYSITDLAAYLKYGTTVHDVQSRVLLVSPRFNFNCGLLVPKVLGLRNAREWQRTEQDGEVYLQDSNGQQWRKLDIAQLLQQPEFIQIGL